MTAEYQEDEAARLNKLRCLEILDTFPEEAYDDITFLAAKLAETPIALITLVDQDRQWFKSKVGVEICETPRDHAICAHAIRAPHELLVVTDAKRDPRFSDNPLVTGPPGIRFYAGAPLLCSDGMALGTLCVIDQRPRTLTELQEQALRVLARQVVAQIELRAALARVKRLQGMLPICAHCKKIREDSGYWQRVETYISEHSEARFTHGICPDCMDTLYPEASASIQRQRDS